jgi:hypothetical protein
MGSVVWTASPREMSTGTSAAPNTPDGLYPGRRVQYVEPRSAEMLTHRSRGKEPIHIITRARQCEQRMHVGRVASLEPIPYANQAEEHYRRHGALSSAKSCCPVCKYFAPGSAQVSARHAAFHVQKHDQYFIEYSRRHQRIPRIRAQTDHGTSEIALAAGARTAMRVRGSYHVSPPAVPAFHWKRSLR